MRLRPPRLAPLPPRFRVLVGLCACVCVFATANPRAVAQGMGAPREAVPEALPPRLTASLLVRVLAYDNRVIPADPPQAVAVVWTDEASRKACAQPLLDALAEVTRDQRIGGRSLAVKALPAAPLATFGARLGGAEVHALFLCPASAEDTRTVFGAAGPAQVLTFTGTRAALASGAAVALVREGSRPRIVVHKDAAQDQGAKLDAGLLRLVELFAPEGKGP